ncbi:hypothetical protein Tco_0618935, partial [Tanacetum coccineum]
GLVQPGLHPCVPALVEAKTRDFLQGLIQPGLDQAPQSFPRRFLVSPHLLLVL